MMNKINELFDDVIYAYSRAQAIEDGVLVDVSDMAKQSGFKIPVAVTRAVWEQYIEWNDGDNDNQIMQDQSGRLWDVLWMLYVACKRNNDVSYITYELDVIPRDGVAKSAILVELRAVICGGDEGEPVITIMLITED